MLVWIGNAPDGPAVGASYDPASRSWQPIATSPLGARESFSTVWTGSELFVLADVLAGDQRQPLRRGGRGHLDERLGDDPLDHVAGRGADEQQQVIQL
jgi:hypothetical protein